MATPGVYLMKIKGGMVAGMKVRATLGAVAGTILAAAVFLGCSAPDGEPWEVAEVKTSAIVQDCIPYEREGHSYLVCNRKEPFEKARATCQAVGLDLATVDDNSENAFIKSHLNKAPAYIGLTDNRSEGAWRWLADGALTWCGDEAGDLNAGFTNWSAHEPPKASCEYESLNGRAYWICSDATGWQSARAGCASVGMQLAKIDSPEENNFLARRLTKEAWLGATDSAVPGEWRWLQGSSLLWSGGPAGTPVAGQFVNWKRKKEPSTAAGADCLAIHQRDHGTWSAEACDTEHRWVCEGAPVKDPRAPDVKDCTTIAPQDGRWVATECEAPAAFVCETPPPNAGKKLNELTTFVRDGYSHGLPNIRALEFKDDVSVKDPFAVHGDRFGLRECVDSLRLVGTPEVNLSKSPLETVKFAQFYKGMRVNGRSYGVRRDPLTKDVKSILGRFEHGINITPAVVIPEAQARSLAIASVYQAKTSDYSPPPKGELRVFAIKSGPQPEWEVAWYFELSPVLDRPTYSVFVSAKSGAILMANPWIFQQCSSQTIAPEPAQRELSITAFQQTASYADPSFALGGLVSGQTTNPYVLYTNGVGSNTLPRIYAQCEGEVFPQVVAFDSPNISVTPSLPDANIAAGHFLAAQRCVEYLASHYSYGSGPWLGLDGRGFRDLDLRLYRGPHSHHYNPATGAIYIDLDRAMFEGASIDVTCHEVAHGVAHELGMTGEDLEAQSVQEGFADILGSAAEMSVRGYPGPGGWCTGGDTLNNDSCLRDFRNPEQSLDAECVVRSASGGVLHHSACPRDYAAPEYCTQKACGINATTGESETLDCCGPHRNSTVLSHWFYILANGNKHLNSSGCPYNVEPLSRVSLEEWS